MNLRRCESPGDIPRIAALSAGQAPPAIIGCPHMTLDQPPATRARTDQPPAQDHELPENLFERGAIVAPEIGDGLEVRLQAPQQPDDLDVAMTFGLKTAARSYPVQIAVDVELEEIT